MKLYSLTVGRLYILPSIKLAFHYIYFLPKDELHLFEIWDTMFNLVFVQNSSEHPMWKSFLGHHNTTCKAGKDDSQAYGFQYQNFQIPNVDGVSFKCHQRCLPRSPAKKSEFEAVPGCPRTQWAGVLGCLPSECGMWGTLMIMLDLGLCSSEEWNTG